MTKEEYVREREKLIPIAERIANDIAGPSLPGNREMRSAIWNRTFHSMMDELARHNGLVK